MADMTPTQALAHAPATAERTALIAAVTTLQTALALARTNTVSGTAQVYTVEISGTPTAGTYDIIIEGTTDIAEQTVTLAYNAAASAVQTALRALVGDGLSQTTVTASGTTPNFTHTITFKGTQEDITLTVLDETTGGTHDVAETETTAYAALPHISDTAATLLKNKLMDWAEELGSELRYP